jgi:RimJ/RimL family protein N-acetyltransferase
MEDCIADLAVGTLMPHRRKGYAKTVVSAVVENFARRGGEAIYNCFPKNLASIATARSVGFAPLGRSLILSAPRTD